MVSREADRSEPPGVPTPAADGFVMPAEWEPHDGCLMIWPYRRELWGKHLQAAQRDYAAVANAIAQFEPVHMVCNKGDTAQARRLCGAGVQFLELPVDDSWARDSGPCFVRNRSTEEVAAVAFRFNAWGNRWHPHDADRRFAARVAGVFGVRLYEAPLVLEGGAFLVDGQGTIFVTDECLLNRNRNPDLTPEQIERYLKGFLGGDTVIWLPYGHSLDTGPTGTDGHIDGVAQIIAPAEVLLNYPSDNTSPEWQRARSNARVLTSQRDAAGRAISIVPLDVPADASVDYVNHYLANNAVIVPVGSDSCDAAILDVLKTVYPDRAVVPVPGVMIGEGGGGPHCITQQIPKGVL